MKSSNRNQVGNRPPEPLEQRARELWHAAARQVDPATAARLRAARREALQAAATPARHPVRWLIPSGAVAAIALATLMVWQPRSTPPGAVANQAGHGASAAVEAENELPPDAEQVDPALYQNLDFYAWLAANDNQAATR